MEIGIAKPPHGDALSAQSVFEGMGTIFLANSG